MLNQPNLRDYAIDKLTSGTSAHETSRTFTYNGTEITFLNSKNVMVNATEMAKSFGKRTVIWLNNQQSKDYIEALSKVRNLTLTDLVEVRRGGSNPGTWMHQDVALEFARWLSPAFAIWTNDRIKELLTTGVATINNDDETIANAMLILQKRLDSQKQKVQILEGENEIQKEQIKELAPKAEYVDNVLQSTRTYTSTQLAKELGYSSAKKMHNKLKDLGIMFYQSGQWMLFAKHCGKDYTKARTTHFDKSDGTKGSNTITVWTEKGRQFIHSLKEEGKL